MNAANIKRIRVKCSCGADIGVPLNAHHTPDRCFHCASPLPSAALISVVRELSWLSSVSKDEKVPFSIEIESEE